MYEDTIEINKIQSYLKALLNPQQLSITMNWTVPMNGYQCTNTTICVCITLLLEWVKTKLQNLGRAYLCSFSSHALYRLLFFDSGWAGSSRENRKRDGSAKRGWRKEQRFSCYTFVLWGDLLPTKWKFLSFFQQTKPWGYQPKCNTVLLLCVCVLKSPATRNLKKY